MDDISADGANVEMRAQEVGGSVAVDDPFTGHQFRDGDTEGAGEGAQKGNIGEPPGGLPFGYRLAADADQIGKVCLGKAFAFTKLFDSNAGDVRIRQNRSLLPLSIIEKMLPDNLRCVEKWNENGPHRICGVGRDAS